MFSGDLTYLTQHQTFHSKIGISILYKSSVPRLLEEKMMQNQLYQLVGGQPTEGEVVVCKLLTHNWDLSSNTLRQRSKHQRTDRIALSIRQHISFLQFAVVRSRIPYQQKHGYDQHYRGPGNMEVLGKLCARA